MNDPHNFGTRVGLTTDNIKLANDVKNTLAQGIATLSETTKTAEKIATQASVTLDKITDKTIQFGITDRSFQELNTTINNLHTKFDNSFDKLGANLKDANSDFINTLDRIDAMDKEVKITVTNIGDANRFVKTTGICLIGLTGSSAGIFLMYKGFNKAFIDNDDKNDNNNNNNPGNNSSWNSIKPYVINNYTKGLLTAGIGAGMVFGGLKVLCNSDKVLGYLS